MKPGREDEIIRPDQGECYHHKMVIKFSAEQPGPFVGAGDIDTGAARRDQAG